jgi:hypothetical protein
MQAPVSPGLATNSLDEGWQFSFDNYAIDNYAIDNYAIDNYAIDNYAIDNYAIEHQGSATIDLLYFEGCSVIGESFASLHKFCCTRTKLTYR